MSTTQIIKERLSPDERHKLQNQLKGYAIFSIIAIAMCVLFFWVWPKDMVSLIALSAFWGFAFSVIAYLIIGPVIDLSRNEKIIVKGVVGERISKVGRKTSSISRSIIIDGEKYYCEFHHWKDLRSGYYVELHYAPKSNHTLKVAILGRGTQEGYMQNTGAYQKRTPPLLPEDFDAELTRADMQIVWKSFRKWMRQRILVLLIIAWPMLGFILAGHFAIMLFLFPFPLTFIVILFWIIRKWLIIKNDQRRGIKNILSSVVLDKTIYIKRHHSFYRINTNQGKMNVDKKFYEQIQVNEVLKIIKLPKSKMLIGVINSDNQFIPIDYVPIRNIA